MRSGSPSFECESEFSLRGLDDELDYHNYEFEVAAAKKIEEEHKVLYPALAKMSEESEKEDQEKNAEKNLKAIQALIEQRAQLEQQDKTAPKIAELTVYINWLAEKAKKHGITAIVEIAAKAESARQQDKFKFLAAPQKSPGAGGQVSAPTLGKV